MECLLDKTMKIRHGLMCAERWKDIPAAMDIKLTSEDNHTFSAHKAILASFSLYFRAQFRWSEVTHTALTIFSEDQLKDVLVYAYEGTLPENDVPRLMTVANYFASDRLLKDCMKYMMAKMDAANCIGVRAFASFFLFADLEKEADWYLHKNFVEVSTSSDEFLHLPLSDLKDILSSDRINVPGEEAVWEAVLRWMDFDLERRKQHLPTLLGCVRRGLLDTEYFMENIKSNTHVEADPECRPLVMETLRFLWDLESIGDRCEVVRTPPIATPRLPHDIIFSFGGWSENRPIALMETYDSKADRWRKVDQFEGRQRAYHKIVAIGTDVYVVGGFDGRQYFNTCWCFNVVSQKWRIIAPMNQKRCYVSVVQLNDSIYAIGGYDGRNRLRSVERYDIQINQWTLIQPMGRPRSDACATTLEGRIYITGGFNGWEVMDTCEWYDPNEDVWTTVIQPMRQKRSGVSCVAFNGSIYVVGGFDGTSRLSTVERLDVDTMQWTEVPEMSHCRSNFAVSVVDNLIFAIGGFNGVTTIYNVECYNPNTGEWYEATDMTSPRSALATCVVSLRLEDAARYSHPDRSALMEEKRQRMYEETQRRRQLQDIARQMTPVVEELEEEVEERESL